MKTNTIIIIVLSILIIGSITGTAIYTWIKYRSQAMILDLDVPSTGTDGPNTSMSDILNDNTYELPLNELTLINNGIQVLTMTKDLYVGEQGLNIDKLYIYNPDGYSIRGSNYCSS